METYGVKATFYDLFGYVIPGAVLVGMISHVGVSIMDEACHGDIYKWVISTKTYSFLAFLCLSCVAGHFLAALSSMIIEKGVCVKIKKLAGKFSLATVLPTLHGRLKEEYKAQFGVEYDSSDSPRLLSAFVEERMPRAYSTAFIFLSLYGMARNFAFVFFISSLVEAALAINGCGMYSLAAVLLLPSIVFFFQYLKFRKHFIGQIYSAYLAYRSEQPRENSHEG